jgi:hypothetical protein
MTGGNARGVVARGLASVSPAERAEFLRLFEIARGRMWLVAAAVTGAGACAGTRGAAVVAVAGWFSGGSLSAGLLAASFPTSVPTLAPFAGALLASTGVSLLLVWLKPPAHKHLA